MFKIKQTANVLQRVFLFILVGLCFIITTSETATAQDNSIIKLDFPNQIKNGDNIKVPIVIDQVKAFDAASYDIIYDPTVLRLNELFNGLIGNKQISVDAWNEAGYGRIMVVQNLPGLTGVSGTGTLAEISFTVVGKPGQSSVISFENGVLSNNLAQEIPAVWLENSFNVFAPVTGDLNNDGMVDIMDLRKFVLGYGTVLDESGYDSNSDFNHDGKINIFDLVIMARNCRGG